MSNDTLQKTLDFLDQFGVPIPEGSMDSLGRYLELIREWNGVASLVSEGDARGALEGHVADSLGLAPILQSCALTQGLLLDVGSGGGFPAIPLKVIFPELSMVLVERSSKKGAFLAKVRAALRLEGIELVSGSFPEALPAVLPQVITARAIERPNEVIPDLCAALPPGAMYLCQSGDPSGTVPEGYTVEHSIDDWEETGLRRAEVYIIRREE